MRPRLALLGLVPLFALAASLPGRADDVRRDDAQVDDAPAHIAAARGIYGTGRSDPDAYARLARWLAEGLDAPRPPRDAVDALVWSVRALGASGDASYMPLIERAAASPVRAIAREARDAREVLHRTAARGAPLVLPEHVRTVTQAEADGCRYLRTHMCRGGEDADECLDEHRALVAEAGGNAVLVLTRVGNAGFAQYDTGSMVAKHYRCPVPLLD